MKKEIRQKVYEKFGGRCAYCGFKIEYKDMQVDHLYPQRLSNLWDYTEEERAKCEELKNDFNNLMPSCRNCNHYKRADLLESFRRSMLTLTDRIRQIYIVKVAIKFGLLELKNFDGKFFFEKNND